MIFREEKFFVQFILHTQRTTQNRLKQKKQVSISKNKNGDRFQIGAWDMQEKSLHFLSLCTEMAFRPILEQDL